VMEAGPPKPAELSRVAQLINKTNQFNLTTRRYTEVDIERMVNDPNVLVRRFRLTDRFGDNGLIAVIIARRHDGESNTHLIDTWLMSCRVLGRGVEAACLGVLARAVVRTGSTALIGEYRPSQRNEMVRRHYPKLGFASDVEDPNGATLWRFELANYTEPASFIRIVE
jgi:FkbH-like protein